MTGELDPRVSQEVIDNLLRGLRVSNRQGKPKIIRRPCRTDKAFEPAVDVCFKHQLILPKEPSEKAKSLLRILDGVGLGGIFKAYTFSGVTLTRDTQILGLEKPWIKPPDSFWNKIACGYLDKGAAKLPKGEVLVDIIKRPNFKDGKQVHEEDRLGDFLAKLREERSIITDSYVPKTSRFGIRLEPDITQKVPGRIQNLLGKERAKVGLITYILFNVLGNFTPECVHFGSANTDEWLADKLKTGERLYGGNSAKGGLGNLKYDSPNSIDSGTAFRLMIEVK